MTSGGVTGNYLRDDGGSLLANVTGGTRTWYGTDTQGSVRQTLDDGGNFFAAQPYDPYGIPETSGQVGIFGYTGELQDGTTNAEYLRARWYQPGTGTLLGVDPELDSTGQAYAYAGDDPVDGSDPSGACYTVVGARVLDFWKSLDGRGACTASDENAIRTFSFRPDVAVTLTSSELALLTGDSSAASDLEAQRILTEHGFGYQVNVPPCSGSGSANAPTSQPSHGSAVTAVAAVAVGVGTAAGEEADTTGEGCLLGGLFGCVAGAVVGVAIVVHTTVNIVRSTGVSTTDTSSQDQQRTYQRFVADTGVFADRVEGGAAQRARADAILVNPGYVLYVPQAVVDELADSPSASQALRLAGVPGGAQIRRIANPPLFGLDLRQGAIISDNFDLADVRVVEAARQLGIPVLTTVHRLQSQVKDGNFPERVAAFGRVPIVYV